MKQNIKVNLLPNNYKKDSVYKNTIIFIILFFIFINFQYICVPYLEYRDNYNQLKVANNIIYIDYLNFTSLLTQYNINDELYHGNMIVNDLETKIMPIEKVRSSIYANMSNNNYITYFNYQLDENVITITLDLEYERELQHLVEEILEEDNIEKIEIGTIQEKNSNNTRRIVTTLEIHLVGDKDE